MNLLARLLLEIRIEFCFFFSLVAESWSVLLKQSGRVARIEGVTLGSNSIGGISSKACKLDH
jgi:hypothetical protein